MEIRIKISLPEDPAKRALVIAVICSVLLHVVLLGSLFTFNSLTTPSYVKRGEPLLVDLAPDKPEEKAPAGNPARPVGPPAEPAPRAPEPPAPKIAEAPPAPKLPPAPRVPPAPRMPPAPRAPAVAKTPPLPPKEPTPRPPEPPRQVAKAEPPAPRPSEPPAPSPDALTKAPEPAPRTPDPAPAAPDPPRGLAAPPPVPPGPGGERSAPSTQTALARPPQPQAPSIFRNPGGGGGLQSGRGGIEGDPIPLDTPEPKYQDYFNKIREKIRANWIYPREAGDRGLQGELLLEFHIAKDGRLEHLSLRNSSGAEILDRFAMNAVRLAQPFPPVPDDIAKRVLAINGLFRYQIVGASMLNHYLR
jgi:TonB family protein